MDRLDKIIKHYTSKDGKEWTFDDPLCCELVEIAIELRTDLQRNHERLKWLEIQEDGRIEIGIRYSIGYFTGGENIQNGDNNKPGWYYQQWDEFIEGILHGPYDTFLDTIDAAMKKNK